MKQIVCEMCEGTSFLKQDGFFVCQGCGCKYSPEEAKKLMVEVEGDAPQAAAPQAGPQAAAPQNDEAANLLQLARRAVETSNWESAGKYYDALLVKEPNSWEAAFYTVYAKAMECKIAQISSACYSISNCVRSVAGLIRDHVAPEEQSSALDTLVNRCRTIAALMASASKNHYEGIDSDIRSRYFSEYSGNLTAAREISMSCGDAIDSVFGSQPKLGAYAARAWKNGLSLSDSYSVISSSAYNVHYVEKIGKYDQAYLNNFQQKKSREERESKKQALNSEITQLNQEAQTLQNKKIRNGVYGIIVSISYIILGFFLPSLNPYDGFLETMGPVLIILGVIFLFVGISQASKYRQKCQERDARLAVISKTVAEKKEELKKYS